MSKCLLSEALISTLVFDILKRCSQLNMSCTSQLCLLPYQSKTMGKIWQLLGHMQPTCGTDMGWSDGSMALIWSRVLLISIVWKIHGLESLL